MIDVGKCMRKYGTGIIASLLIVAGAVYIFENQFALASNTHNNAPYQEIENQTSSVELSNGIPVKIAIKNLNVQLSVKEGEYESTTATWDLDDKHAFYANGTSTSLLYGHNTKNVFGKIHTLKRQDIVNVAYGDGTIKSFQMVAMELVKPHDSSVLFESSPYDLILLTCSGIFDQDRRLVYLRETGSRNG